MGTQKNIEWLRHRMKQYLIIHDRVKEEVQLLLGTGFIRPCRYMEWVSNIVPVENKNISKIQVCIDFCNLNKATPKDE
jgi:hypothetical protein